MQLFIYLSALAENIITCEINDIINGYMLHVGIGDSDPETDFLSTLSSTEKVKLIKRLKVCFPILFCSLFFHDMRVQ